MKSDIFTYFKFIGQGDEYFDTVIAQIDSAEVDIIMESYIFEFDDVGKRVLAAMARAAKRQVRTRLVVDGIGSYSSASQIESFCNASGIHFRVYRALPRLLARYHRFRQFLRLANRRNHRKVLIIDKKTAIIASYNISKAHSETISGKEAWKDLAAVIQGSEIIKIWELTNAYWTTFRLSLSRRVPKIKFTHFRSTHSMFARRTSRNLLFEKIKYSQSHIKILTPYFLPSTKLLRVLSRASLNHQNIEIVIPIRSDFLISDLAARHVLRKLLKHKIRVFQYKPSFLHAKSVQVDNWATMGSHNLNTRSLVHDLELDVLLEQPEELASIENYWQTIKATTVPITFEDLAKDSFFTRLLCRFSFWFKNWL